MDEVEDLVITPFREIVDKAKRAIGNAGDANPVMLKAAQTLLKEGERGLKRIEPQCKKHIDEYGPNFVASLKDNDDIANFRADLNDLLWEFEDFIEPDDFDPDKFVELQAMSRKAAPKIYDILMRMKLEAPVSDAASSRGSVAQLPTPTSPNLHPGSLLGLGASAAFQQRGSASSSVADYHDGHSQLRGMMRSPASSAHDSIDATREPPRPPSMNPWDWQTKPAVTPAPAPPGSDPRTPDEIDFDRRIAESESPILPATALSTEQFPRVPVPPSGGPPSATSAPSDYGGGEEDRRYSSTSQSQMQTPSSDRGAFTNGYYSAPSRQRNIIVSPPMPIPEDTASQRPSEASPSRRMLPTFPIPEDEVPQQVPQQHGAIPFFQKTTAPYSPVYTHQSHSRHSSVPRSADSDAGSDLARHDLGNMPSPGSRPRELSNGSLVSPLQPGPPPPVQPAADPESAAVLSQMDAGPIPVESENMSKFARSATMLAEYCRITDDSSFQLAKGFCEGAKDVIRGGIGVKRTKKNSTVARCLCCLYELDFRDIETDVNKEDKGTFSKGAVGIDFRVRFLQKSHVHAKRPDDIQYACVFCIRSGQTLDRSDATVFFTQKALFEHLARHPRPLPETPGVTVIETEEVPEKHKNDFDLHFKKPVKPHPVIEKAGEIANLPTGVAKDHARRLFGQRLLYDRSPALELAQGARITGMTWPERYQGEWIFGWHDAIYASIPTDLVKIDAPPRNEVRYDRTSRAQAKARWKFAVKDKDKDNKGEWLKFEKNETITNIAWSASDHWCWSGTNSKGKSGIFPQAFLDMESLMEPPTDTSARAGSLYEEKVRSSANMFTKLSMRKNSGRPPSIASSAHS